ncbi:MAG: hypothetical protein GKR89_06310 [Candidatus Latescibacteria bacterium]|nr:hypothetical protein [Candidatus Latescibacterota bacterium]
MPGFTPDQLDFFRTQGYLLVENVLDPAAFDRLIGEIDAIVDQYARQTHAAGHLTDLGADLPFPKRLAHIHDQLADPAPLLGLVNGKLKTEGMFQILTQPALLDIVEAVIGPEILAHPQFNLRAKLPNQDASVVPWHQDLGYLQPDAEETFMVNFWIPLVDATPENGCMEVIAGSHQTPLIGHDHGMGPGANFKGITDDYLPSGEEVSCPVKKGGVLLIQHKTIHRSIPNLSDHIRWSLDLRYSDPAQPSGRDEVPGFIARSQADPASVAQSLDDWLALFAAPTA